MEHPTSNLSQVLTRRLKNYNLGIHQLFGILEIYSIFWFAFSLYQQRKSKETILQYFHGSWPYLMAPLFLLSLTIFVQGLIMVNDVKSTIGQRPYLQSTTIGAYARFRQVEAIVVYAYVLYLGMSYRSEYILFSTKLTENWLGSVVIILVLATLKIAESIVLLRNHRAHLNYNYTWNHRQYYQMMVLMIMTQGLLWYGFAYFGLQIDTSSISNFKGSLYTNLGFLMGILFFVGSVRVIEQLISVVGKEIT